MTCVKYLSEGVKRVGKESIKWNEYVSDGVWSSDLHSALHTHRAAVTPSPSGYNKVSQWYSEPRRLSHLRHLSVCACTLHSLIQPTSAFFLCASCSLPPPSFYSCALLSKLTFYPLTVCVQLKVNKNLFFSLFSPNILSCSGFFPFSLFL